MKNKIVIIGVSTGGPSLIKKILHAIKTLSYTLIIAQHMREEVLPFFIKELQASSSHLNICGTPHTIDFSNPCVIICASSVIFSKKDNFLELKIDSHAQKFTPDINNLLYSLAPFMSSFDATVIIMTGIGNDGVEAAKALKELGAKVFAQDEESSPVYGMPKAALESKIVDSVKSFDEIQEFLKG